METSEIRDFRRSMRRFERLTNAQLRACCNVATLAQCLVLMELDEAGPLVLGELATRLRLDSSTLSRTVDGMVKQGLLERRRGAEDRRLVWVALTARGQAACRQIHHDNDGLCRRVFAKIPESRRASVLSSFDLLVQAFLDCETEAAAVTEPAR